MRTFLASALVLGVGCADPGQDQIEGLGAGVASKATPLPTVTSPPRACLGVEPSGRLIFGNTLATGSDQRVDVAIDVRDALLYALPDFGLTKATGDGTPIFTRDFGALVTTDAAGNLYVAGMFDRVRDFGLGDMIPHGDGHAYLVKLDSSGTTVWAREVPPCGTLSIRAIAVDATDRIALSGYGMGTEVFDPDGALLFASPLVGELAFSAAGDLAIVGSTADYHAFVAELDRSGNVRWQHTFGGAAGQTGTGVAIDRAGNVAVVGDFTSSIDVFGQLYEVGVCSECDMHGAFTLLLSPTGDLRWGVRFPFAQEIADVVFDPLGNLLVSTDETGSQEPFRIPTVFKLDKAGNLWGHTNALNGYGYSHGLAVDSCGRTFWGVTIRDFSTDHVRSTYLEKLAI